MALGSALGKSGQIDHLVAASATLRIRVDALRGAHEAPKDVVEATLSDLRAINNEMKPLAAVANEFRKRWKKQKSGLLQKREAEIEYALRQASAAQISRLEEEAEDQQYLINQDVEAKQQIALTEMFVRLKKTLHGVVDTWRRDVASSCDVRDRVIDDSFNSSINSIIHWALREESRIMGIWEQELSSLVSGAYTLDEEEVNAMEKARVARCNLAESTVERQQQDLQDFRHNVQGGITSMTKAILRRSQTKDEKLSTYNTQVKRQARTRISAKKEAEAASQLYVDVAIRYLDEAAALERARVSAYHTAMQAIGPELAEHLQDSLQGETEKQSSKTYTPLNTWGTTAAGLPNTFGGSGKILGGQSSMVPPTPASLSDDEDMDEATALSREVHNLREKARSMMASVGRGDWRKDILEVADEAIEGLRHTESALAAGPLHASDTKDPRSMQEALNGIDDWSRDFSEIVLKEFTRMRNVKVALSCSRAKHVREAMQQYEWNATEIEESIMPAVSKLYHEVEVVREVIHASKHGKEKMPIYVLAGSFRRSLLATYPALRRLWEAADVPDSERKNFIRKLAMMLAVEPGIVSCFRVETEALEQTLPAPDWAVSM